MARTIWIRLDHATQVLGRVRALPMVKPATRRSWARDARAMVARVDALQLTPKAQAQVGIYALMTALDKLATADLPVLA